MHPLMCLRHRRANVVTLSLWRGASTAQRAIVVDAPASDTSVLLRFVLRHLMFE